MVGPRVVVHDVIKVYEGGGGKVTALRGVSLEVGEGEMVAIMGPSGSGKTTLLNIVSGIDKPTGGYVEIGGTRVSELPEEELRLFRLENIGYVFQFFNLIPTLNAVENVELPMILKGLPGKERRERALKLLQEVGLEGKEERMPHELSGGEQQRLAIAVALANDPPLLIADEPTGELDLATGSRIVELLRRESKEKGKTVIISTHDPRVARMTDRVVVLEDGVIKGSYEPSRLTDIAGGGIHGEVAAERVIVEYIKRRMAELEEEEKRLIDRLRTGEIGAEEFAEAYQEIRAARKAYRAELIRLGAGAEA